MSLLSGTFASSILILGFMYLMTNAQAHFDRQVKEINVAKVSDDVRTFLNRPVVCNQTFGVGSGTTIALQPGQSIDWGRETMPMHLRSQNDHLIWAKLVRSAGPSPIAFLHLKIEGGKDDFVIPMMAEFDAVGQLTDCSSELLDRGVELACPKN